MAIARAVQNKLTAMAEIDGEVEDVAASARRIEQVNKLVDRKRQS